MKDSHSKKRWAGSFQTSAVDDRIDIAAIKSDSDEEFVVPFAHTLKLRMSAMNTDKLQGMDLFVHETLLLVKDSRLLKRYSVEWLND